MSARTVTVEDIEIGDRTATATVTLEGGRLGSGQTEWAPGETTVRDDETGEDIPFMSLPEATRQWIDQQAMEAGYDD